MQAFPEVLRQQNYQNPSDSAQTAFQVAHNTDQPAYSWTPPDPETISAFVAFMKSQREGQKNWTSSFPVELLKLDGREVSSGRVLFVDVGGSAGHQCISLRQRGPDLLGGMVLQDQAMVIDRLNKPHLAGFGIVAQVHDFFQEQPVRGAKAYYLRNVMHDWPDDKCVEILQQLREACAVDSMVLIDEMVLADDRVSWKQAQKDVQMMACLAAMERSRKQWKDLLAKAGLTIQQICTYDQEMGDAVIVAMRA